MVLYRVLYMVGVDVVEDFIRGVSYGWSVFSYRVFDRIYGWPGYVFSGSS